MTVLKLLLVRHAQSVGNTEGRMEGCSSTDLTPLGMQQSLHLGQHLAATHWWPTHIYCSPLTRATATLAGVMQGLKPSALVSPNPLPEFGHLAAIAADPPSVNLPSGQAIPLELRDDLKEYDAGILTGLTWAEASKQHPDLCHQLETSLDWQPIPQAETLEQGHTRAEGAINHLLCQHANGDRVLVISHHWLLQHMIARLLGSDRVWGLPISNTACFEFWLDSDRWLNSGVNRLNTELWQIKRFNDVTHLKTAAGHPK